MREKLISLPPSIQKKVIAALEPREVAPADIHIVATGKDDAPFDAAEQLAAELEGFGVRVLLDDRRGVSPGVKFNDAELLGVPTIAVVGRGLAEGFIELRDRASGQQENVAVGDFVAHVRSLAGR